MSKVEDVLRKLTLLKHLTGLGLGSSFCNFLEKSDFNAIESHFAHVQSHLKELDF